jgi:hypothetical protein
MPDVTLGGAFLVGRAGVFLREVQHSERFTSHNRRVTHASQSTELRCSR